MTTKQEIVMNELLKGSTVTEACKTAKISRKTYYQWIQDKSFTEELNNRKKAILSDCVMYLRSKFKDMTEELVSIIENPDTKPQIKVNAIDAFFRTYRSIAEEDCISRLDEIEQQLKQLEGEADEVDG